MDDPGAPIYSISAVERMVGVPAATLRNWEDRYGLIQPERSPGGQRLYTREQVDHVRFLAEQLDEGLQPADAHRLLAERLSRAPDEPADEPSAAAPDAERMVLILLAERDPYAAGFAEFVLRADGYDVVVAFDTEEAERICAERSPELVIVEWLISGGAGAELCRRLKESGASACLAISSLDAREQALEAGADAFLPKPLDLFQLTATAKELLGRSAYINMGPSGSK